MFAAMPELVFHDFREGADFDRALRAREAVPFRRIELDLRLGEASLEAPEDGLDVERLFAFARDRDFDLFIHLVDASAYTDRSLALLRSRLEGEGQLDDGTIVGSTHLLGLLRLAEALPEVRNQGRFPVPGIRYVHKFGPDLLARLAATPDAFATTSRALEALWGVAAPPARRGEFDAMSLIASFDAIDKRTGAPIALDEYAAGAERLARLPVLDLLITNGLKRADALPRLATMGFRAAR
jgi:hypothetical protein